MISDLKNNQAQPSLYQPPQDVLALTKVAKETYGKGFEILHKDWQELNDYSVIERMNKDHKAFNSYVNEQWDDENESWKWKGTRGIGRNKAMVAHAHATAVLAVPMPFAQNEKQEEDRDMSNVMRDVLMWMATEPNSEYQDAYLAINLSTLYNPVSFLGAEYREVSQTIREKTEQGYETKEILDEVLTGFKCPVYSPDQVLITNAYEQNIQKQRTIIKRRYIDYQEAEAKWKDHPYWGFVKPGIKAIYSEEDGLFYDVFDENHRQSLVEEVIFLSRRDDNEVTFINGIYMGNENVEYNPIKHRDNRNAPKYNVIPFGYERINEHFFYYKSLMNKIGWDNALIDAMYENTMNRDTLDLHTPVAITGVDNVDTGVIFPGSVVAFDNPDAEVKPIIPPNRVSGYQALREIEKSISEASTSEVTGGALPEPEQKAFNVARAEQNARTILRGTFRSIAQSVAQYGQLMINIALQHLTTAQLDEITGAVSYRPFVLQDQMVNGKKVSKKIIFEQALVGARMSQKEKEKRSLKLLEETGYPNEKDHIYLVNPHLFSKMKYFSRIEADVLMEKNEALEKAITERLYALLRQEPLIEPEALVRKLLNAHYKGEAEDMMARIPREMPTETPTVEMPARPKAAIGETRKELAEAIKRS